MFALKLKDIDNEVFREEEALSNNSGKLSKPVLNGIVIAVAIIMLIYGINKAISIVNGGESDDWVDSLKSIWAILMNTKFEPVKTSPYVQMPGAVLFIVCAFLILFDVRRGFVRTVGFYAFCMGACRITSAIPLIRSHMGPTSIVGWLIFILGSNLVISGYYMLSGQSRGRLGMLASGIAMLLIELEYIAVMLFAKYDISNIVTEHPAMVISCFMFMFLIWLLDTDEVRYSDKLSRHIRILKNIDNTYRATDLLTINEDDLVNLMDGNMSEWKVPDVQGPVEKEYHFVSDGKYGKSFIIVQKWKDSKKLYYTVSGMEDNTLVYAERFSSNSIILENDTVESSDTASLMGDGSIITVKILHPELEAAA